MNQRTKITREKIIEEIVRLEYNIVESKNYKDRETVIVYQGIIKELKITLNKIENDLVE